MGKVAFQDSQGIRREIDLGIIATIGRHPDQTIQILDRVVSKAHAVIERKADGSYLVRDCGSRNGTYVNGRMIEGVQLLVHGDVVSVGSTDLSFMSKPGDARPEQRRLSLQTEDIDAHIRSKVNSDRSTRFLPESQISDIVSLRQDYEKLRIANELNQSIGVEMDLDVLLDKILEKAFEIFPADTGVILLRVEGTSELVPMVMRSRDGEANMSDVRISRTILNEVMEEKQAVLSSDAMMDSRFSGAHSIILGNIRSTMSVPLLHDDTIQGVIHLDSKIARGAFTEKDLQILTGFARQAAMLIEHHRLIKRMEEQVVVREKLNRLLSPQLVEEVVAGRLEFKKGGEQRRATVMFADIRGFTTFSERHAPQEVVELLNEYFELMVDAIFKYEGTLDKFIGDEIMAVWGAPISRPDDTERAVRAAVEMQRVMEAFNSRRAMDAQSVLRMGIGMNTGELVAGYMGSTKSMNYTVMGDTVNTAARLCSAAGPGQIVIGPQTYREMAHILEVEALPPTQLKGKAVQLDLYRIIGLKG